MIVSITVMLAVPAPAIGGHRDPVADLWLPAVAFALGGLVGMAIALIQRRRSRSRRRGRARAPQA